MMFADTKLSVKSTKEVECQHTAAVEPKPETPKGNRVGVFNAEDFLTRAQMNDKINNILRSPTKTTNGVRQRSVFTNSNPSPPSSLRCMQSMPLQLSTRMSNMSLGNTERSSSSSLTSSATVGTNTAVLARECSSQTNTPVRGFSSPSTYLPPTASQFGPPVINSTAANFDNNNLLGYNCNNMPRSNNVPRYPSMGSSTTSFGFEDNNPYCTFPTPMPPPPYALGRVSSRNCDLLENPSPPTCHTSGPIAMSNGTIQLRLREGVRIDMTVDKAVRVLNQRTMVAISLSRNGTSSALIHPNGRILQNGSKVEIVTYDGMKSNNFVRYAKMWYKGVSFTSESCALIYLVDTAGTRTTTDTFTDLTKDYTLAVFYDDSRHGPSFMSEVHEVIGNSQYTCTDDGTEVYDINGFRITQAADGLVKVTRGHNKSLIRTSPANGSATLTTSGIHCTASLGKTSHLFVRRNEKRMHFDGSCFIVRNAGHSAGFNESNLLIVY